jgi:excinuclease ABC subunit A
MIGLYLPTEPASNALPLGRNRNDVLGGFPPTYSVHSSRGELSLFHRNRSGGDIETTDGAGWIEVRGARTHNLKGIDLKISRGTIAAFTGVSGSGKTSLAFDTIFAEGQRRYFETTAPALRSVLDQLPAPDVDAVLGLPPTLSVEQHASASAGPRSTVATVSELHDYLRVLYARAGIPFCPNCGTEIHVLSADQITDEIMKLPEGEKIHLLAPMTRGKEGDLKEELLRIKREAFVRIRLDGVLGLADANLTIDPTRPHDLDMVVDRQVVRAGSRDRILESVALTLKHGDGTMIVATLDEEFNWHDRTYTSKFACPNCHTLFAELEPRTFSFNSPYGACPACGGMGVIGEESNADDEDDAQATESKIICPECHGDRLGPAGRSVKLSGVTLPELLRKTIADSAAFFEKFASEQSTIADDPNLGPILASVRSRLGFLDRVGVGYLQLERPTKTLSGGEAQRVRLAGCVGAALRGVCYVLDEPTLGLHARDVSRLMEVLEHLRDSGASVLMVEHDEEAIRRADWLVEIGPGAGTDGGRLINAAPREKFLQGPGLTAEYLTGKRVVGPKEGSLIPNGTPEHWLELAGVTHRNLKNVTLRIPINRLTAVTGVSGSGKSSLIAEVLAPAMQERLGMAGPKPGAFASLVGAEAFAKVVVVDQSPIGRSPKSTPATFLGILDELRSAFAQTKEAKARGFTAARFTFNSKAGQCPSCKGMGVHRVEVKLLGEQWALCSLCQGKRFNADALSVRFRGATISDALAFTVAEAAAFFENHPKVARRLAMLVDLGLGYLRLDQWATTLSGGEAQRLKLAYDLLREDFEGATLFLLDEPTSGLHPHDVGLLLTVLRRLVAAGHTVVAVEHDLDFISACNWAVDLGPEGGDAGGRVLGGGPPKSLIDVADNATGKALARRKQMAVQ